MSIPFKKQNSDKKQDKSDVLSLLMVIKRMFEMSQEVLNTHTQTALMLSVTLEAQMLLMKLQVMKERWQYHLPFKEACGVRFDKWSKWMENMAKSLSPTEEMDGNSEPVDEYCPSKHFLLDLYETLPENASAPDHAPYYKELSVSKFVLNQDRIRKQITKNWLSSYEQRFSDAVSVQVENRISAKLDLICKQDSDIFKACQDTLQELSAKLYELHELCNSEIQTDQFTRLAERVTSESDYEGLKAKQSARNDVHDWKNKTPKKRREKTLQEEIDASIKLVRDSTYGSLLEEYIGEEFDIKGHSAEFGQFLHNVRKNISVTELNDLMLLLYHIRYFKEEQERQKVITAEFFPAEPANPQSKKKEDVYKNRFAQPPRRPILSRYFPKKLANNTRAFDKFYDILHHCGLYIGRPLLDTEKKDPDKSRYEGWKWKHLYQALINLGLLNQDTPKKSYGEYIESVFPSVKAENVIRSFGNRGVPKDERLSSRIIKDIEDEFDAVTTLIQGK